VSIPKLFPSSPKNPAGSHARPPARRRCVPTVRRDGGTGTGAEGGIETIKTVIDDPYTEGDAECVCLESGETIRLDCIQDVQAPTSQRLFTL